MPSANPIQIANLTIGNDQPLTLIAGPCAMESREHALSMADQLKSITESLGMGLIYKSSFDKANRTSVKSSRGIGIEIALDVFAEIRETFHCPVLTDVHEPQQCEIVAKSVDILQIPAYLCRQTDLLLAAGESGVAINIKKGQFLAPWDITNVISKVESTGNRKIMICERGTSFGYNTLVSDMRSLPLLAKSGYPIVFDATHSVQQPGGYGNVSGGQREFAPVLARAAVAIGVAAVFIETHNKPDEAPSDGPNMIPLEKMTELLKSIQEFDKLSKANPIKLSNWS